MPPKANYPPGFGLQNQLTYGSQQATTQGEGTSQAQHIPGTSLESLIKEYMAINDAVIQSQQASLRNLEVQVGQLANELRNRPLGKLPADTEMPKREGMEQCQAIELRSGKEIPSRGEKIKEHDDSRTQESLIHNRERRKSLCKKSTTKMMQKLLYRKNTAEIMQKL